MKQTFMKTYCHLLALAVLSTGAWNLSLAQETAEAEAPFDPRKTDFPTGTRVEFDIKALTEIAGETVGDQISPLLSTICDGEKSDEDRLTAIEQLATLSSALDQSDPKIRSLYRKLERRIRLARVIINALQTTDADESARSLANDLLVRSTVDYENSNRVAHTEVARSVYQQIKVGHPALYSGIRSVYNTDYFNYNLHFVVSENLIQQIVSDIRTESGPVKDCILGAYVTGTQVTNTQIKANVRPSSGSAAFDLLVSGTTSSNTRGTKSPAVVYTRGYHSFNITKPVHFDGQRITSGVATMNVNANNRTVGLSTKYDRIPLLRHIVRKIAMNEVQEKKTQSEAIAARKLADRAIPQFESEVNAKFAEANTNLQTNMMQNLRNRGISPDSFSARSSDSHIAVSSRTIRSQTLAGNLAPAIPVTMSGVSIQVHESALNAGIDGLRLSGRMTIDQVLENIESALTEFMRKPVNLRADTEDLDRDTDFDFDPSDPIRVRLEEGRAVILLRSGFYQISRDRRIPRHSFEIPVEIQLDQGKLLLIAPNTETRNIARVFKPRSIEKGANARSIIQARAVAKKLVEGAFKEDVQVVDPNIEVKLGGGQMLPLTFTHFEITDGWLNVVLE